MGEQIYYPKFETLKPYGTYCKSQLDGESFGRFKENNETPGYTRDEFYFTDEIKAGVLTNGRQCNIIVADGSMITLYENGWWSHDCDPNWDGSS